MTMQMQCGMARSSDFAEEPKTQNPTVKSSNLNVTGNSKLFQHFQQPNTAGLQATMLQSSENHCNTEPPYVG